MLPVWRRDGREIYYLAPSEELVAVEVNADSTFAVGTSTTLFRSPLAPGTHGSPYDAAADGQRFLFAIPSGNAMPPMTTILNWTSLVTKTDR